MLVCADMTGVNFATTDIPDCLLMKVTQHCYIFKLVVRGMLKGTLGVTAAAPDVICAQRPMRVQAMSKAHGRQWQLGYCLKSAQQPACTHELSALPAVA